MKKFLSLILFLYLFISSYALAEQYRLTDEVAAYNQGDYRQVIGLGQLLASQDPKNALVHYFLANSYSRLGETPEAKREYALCESLAKDVQMKGYCLQALSYLDKQRNEGTESLAAKQSSPVFLGNLTIPDRSSLRIAEEKSAILQEQTNLANQAAENAQLRIDDIERQVRRDVSSVPRYIYLTSYQSVPNPAYGAALSRSNIEADKKIASVRADLESIQRAIKKFAQEKLNGLDSSIAGTQSQRSEGVTSLQLAPGASQLFVKDYLHFDLAPMPAFPASALSGMKKDLKQVAKGQSQG